MALVGGRNTGLCLACGEEQWLCGGKRKARCASEDDLAGSLYSDVSKARPRAAGSSASQKADFEREEVPWCCSWMLCHSGVSNEDVRELPICRWCFL